MTALGGLAIGVVLFALLVWLATAALVVAALAHGRDDEQDARLDALERVADGAELSELPTEVEPPRAPIGFKRE